MPHLRLIQRDILTRKVSNPLLLLSLLGLTVLIITRILPPPSFSLMLLSFLVMIIGILTHKQHGGFLWAADIKYGSILLLGMGGGLLPVFLKNLSILLFLTLLFLLGYCLGYLIWKGSISSSLLRSRNFLILPPPREVGIILSMYLFFGYCFVIIMQSPLFSTLLGNFSTDIDSPTLAFLLLFLLRSELRRLLLHHHIGPIILLLSFLLISSEIRDLWLLQTWENWLRYLIDSWYWIIGLTIGPFLIQKIFSIYNTEAGTRELTIPLTLHLFLAYVWALLGISLFSLL